MPAQDLVDMSSGGQRMNCVVKGHFGRLCGSPGKQAAEIQAGGILHMEMISVSTNGCRELDTEGACQGGKEAGSPQRILPA